MIWLGTGAALAFGGGLVLLAVFFATKDERFDHGSEIAFVIFAVLVIPVIVAVRDQLAPSWSLAPIVAIVGIVGVAVVGLAELGFFLRVIDFRKVAGVITLAFLGYLAWIGATSVAMLSTTAFPTALGWLGLGSMALAALIIGLVSLTPGVMRGDRDPSRVQMGSFFLPLVGMVAWMIWLAAEL